MERHLLAMRRDDELQRVQHVEAGRLDRPGDAVRPGELNAQWIRGDSDRHDGSEREGARSVGKA